MGKINIPKQVIQGFELIARLDEKSVNSISEFLSKLEFNTKFKDIGIYFESIVGIENSQLLLQTISSFSELLDEKFDKETIEAVVKNLVESYIEMANPELSAMESSLKANLFSILSNYEKLKIIINCKDLAFDNENIFHTSKILTDIRLLFPESKENNTQIGIILQKIQISYVSNFEKKSLYLTLDLEDLNSLKMQIEEAINAEHKLRENFKNVFHLI